MIFVVLLCCLFCLGFFGYNLEYQESQEQVQIQEITKEIKGQKNVVGDRGYSYFSTGDIVNGSWITALIDYLVELGYSDMTPSTTQPYSLRWYNNTNSIDFNRYVLDSNFQLQLVTQYQSVVIAKTYEYNLFVHYNVKFYDSNNNADFQMDFYSLARVNPQWSAGSNLFNISFTGSNNSIFRNANQYNDCFLNLVNARIDKEQYVAGYNLGISKSEQYYDEGYEDGTDYGKQIAQDRNSDIYQNTYNTGYAEGYVDGVYYGQSQDNTALTIFEGILSVGFLPVNIFLGMFNYEVFGISISGLISSLITIACVMIIIRFLFGGKDNDK